MSIAFIGKGVKALQAANMIPVTVLPFEFITVDILGIYPTLETLIPQMVLLAAFVMQLRKRKNSRPRPHGKMKVAVDKNCLL